MKKSTTGYLLFCLFFIILFQSCATTRRNLIYFSNLSDTTSISSEITNQITPTIQPRDALAIKVATLNPDANILFNSGSLPINNQATGVPTGVNSSATLPDGYFVDENGEIDFPVLGKINLEGLTTIEAQRKLEAEISKTAKDPIVNIRILIFKVTVIGEVTHPGIFSIPDNKVNILEAVGMAGDLTPYAVRDNVLIIREENGKRTWTRINFNDKRLFSSPYYYLHQNDVVYVQPENRLKAAQANSGDFRIWSIILSSVSVIAVVLSRI